MALAACSGGDAPGQSAAAPDPDAHVVLRDPDVVAASGARAALLVSAGLFERARVAVVAAGEADHAAAAEVAQRLRVPALPGDADGLTEELERLGTEVVRTVGEPEGGWGDRLGDREATTEDPDVRVDDPARGLTLLVATKARLDDPSYTLAVATARVYEGSSRRAFVATSRVRPRAGSSTRTSGSSVVASRSPRRSPQPPSGSPTVRTTSVPSRSSSSVRPSASPGRAGTRRRCATSAAAAWSASPAATTATRARSNRPALTSRAARAPEAATTSGSRRTTCASGSGAAALWPGASPPEHAARANEPTPRPAPRSERRVRAVSYTHLTLPTSDLV